MNKIDNDTYIIAHGDSKLDYVPEFIDYISQYSNVIYSSWDDTPEHIIGLLKRKSILFTLNPYPEKEGMSKLGYQQAGFLNGLKLAKIYGAKFIYKMRNDLIIDNLHIILKNLKHKIQFLPNSKEIQLLCWDNLCNGPCDFCIFGSVKEMEIYWSFKDLDKPSERYILPQYFAAKNISYDFTYKSMLQLCQTYIQDQFSVPININWLKNNDESPLQEHFANRVIYL